MNWTRTTALDAVPAGRRREKWSWSSGGTVIDCDMDVCIGKPLDVRALKATSLDEIRSYAAFLRDTAARLYAPGGQRRTVMICPCCGEPAGDAREAIRVFDIPYVGCSRCGHAFVQDQPGAVALSTLFSESDDHAAPYVDPTGIEIRMEQVIVPKIDWVIDSYRSVHGRLPASAADIGAGGGHFVAGLRRAGLAAEGYETSRASRAFARAAFGIDLWDRDFTDDAGTPVDLVSFWGLLEYTPEPRRFLEAARRRMTPGAGLIVVEVPRLNCLGTAVQRALPDYVARHMDPTSHVNTFTDASLATALLETGFRPVAAWYFGMDAYELLIQAALRLDDPKVFDGLADLIPDIQASLDQGMQCDDLVMAAVPAP